ncbi:Cysteine/serine-rich nuclear protein 1 [Larimichthys crocea]|uniref:Uncharacterized protein n=1 Tax=Larimichthys crocea TaxID=215358 RepID=A0ACD3RAD1_LARCR|nr:Cysteine/serine-rich nuclear protein 1 [Larimichthys crocea]
MSGLLKRKFEEVDEDPCYSSPSSLSSACSGWDSEGESCYSDTLDSTPSNPSSPATNFNTTSILKKSKRARRGNVTFDQVTVFFFPRCQGFTSVPSRGGCTLGMMQRHSVLRTYTLAEFAVEQRLLRREKFLNRLREEKLEALKLKLTKNWNSRERGGGAANGGRHPRAGHRHQWNQLGGGLFPPALPA